MTIVRPIQKMRGTYLSSGIEVSDGISFKVIFILPAQHSCDDEDNECYYSDGGQHCSDYPKVIRRVLDHSWKKKRQRLFTVITSLHGIQWTPNSICQPLSHWLVIGSIFFQLKYAEASVTPTHTVCLIQLLQATIYKGMQHALSLLTNSVSLFLSFSWAALQPKQTPSCREHFRKIREKRAFSTFSSTPLNPALALHFKLCMSHVFWFARWVCQCLCLFAYLSNARRTLCLRSACSWTK